MEGKLGIKNNMIDIIQFIFLCILLTLSILLPYSAILFIIMFILINIYLIIKSSMFVLNNDKMINDLLEEDGINIVSKSFFKYNFITRFFFGFTLKKIKKDLNEIDIKMKNYREDIEKNFNKIKEEFEEKINKNYHNTNNTNNINNRIEISNCLKVFDLKSNELNLETIKIKYKNLARQYHPDVNKNIDDTKIKEINSCKDRLVRFLKNKGF